MIASDRVNPRAVAKTIAAAAGLLFLYACPPTPPPPPPVAHNTNVRMCVTQYTGVPYNGNPPTTDGVVANDLGWTNAFRYVFQNGTTVPDGAVQVLKGTDKIYMSIEVNNDDSFDAEDVVVIGIDPDGTKGNYRRLHIFPFEVAPPANSTNVTVPDSRIKYWKGDPGAWGT